MPEPRLDPSVVAAPFGRASIDRDGLARSEDGAAAFDADPRARAVVVGDGRALLAERVDGSAPALELREPASLPPGGLRLFLGRMPDGSPVEARIVDPASTAAIEAESARWIGLREAAPVLGDDDTGLFVEALALARWHETAGFCPNCGAPSEPVQRGWARRCTAEDRLLFPRTDPAVIVLVTDDADRVLLGSNAMWAPDRYSLLAGFVEPGESLEVAVVREIGEEAGIAVDRVEYRASQPWPFPASLMLGFTARVAAGGDAALAVPDGEEILSLRWFSRDELAAAREVTLPGETSIARWLLERWFGGPIPRESA